MRSQHPTPAQHFPPSPEAPPPPRRSALPGSGMRKVMIAGAGELGAFIAERLTAEQMDVTVMDQNPDYLAALNQTLDVATVPGNAANLSDLTAAGAGQMDLFIAATNQDETNLIICLLANELRIPNKIAVTRQLTAQQRRRRFDYHKYGVDLIVNINEAVRDEVLDVIETQGVSELATFSEGRIILIGHQIDSKSKFLGKTVAEVTGSEAESFFHIAAVVRRQALLRPKPELRLEAEDYLYLITTQELLPILKTLLNVESIRSRTAVIFGEDHLAQRLAASLSDRHFQVTLLVSSEERAHTLRDAFHRRRHFRVETGEGTEVKLLRRVKVPSTNLFLSVKRDDATNLAACLVAKHLGAAKTIATIKRNDILPLCHQAGVDVTVAPRLAAAKVIQAAVHEDRLLNYRAVSQTNLEVVELEAAAGSRVVRAPLRQLRLPKGVIVGGVVSDGNPNLVTPDSQIRAGDKVIVLTLPEQLVDVEGWFGGA